MSFSYKERLVTAISNPTSVTMLEALKITTITSAQEGVRFSGENEMTLLSIVAPERDSFEAVKIVLGAANMVMTSGGGWVEA